MSYNDGIAIKQGLGGGTTVTLDFALHAKYMSPDSLAQFSSMGPNIDGAIKPDLVAAGTNIYTAAQKLDSAGALYDPSGYGVYDGTSFSAPIVAGAAALVKAARPGLTAAQYKSLLVNNTGRISAKPGSAASAQEAGAGALDVSAALRATAAMEPVSLSFGVGGAGTLISKNLIVTNVGTARETFLISPVPKAGSPAPTVSLNSVTLDPAAATMLQVTLSAAGLGAGAYEGFITITGSTSGAESRVPYWFGVPSDTPAYITIVDSATSLRPGTLVSDAVIFHVADAAGIIMRDVTPRVTVVSGGGSVVAVVSRSGASPGAFGLNVRLGRGGGTNVFRITAGSVSLDVPLVTQ